MDHYSHCPNCETLLQKGGTTTVRDNLTTVVYRCPKCGKIIYGEKEWGQLTSSRED